MVDYVREDALLVGFDLVIFCVERMENPSHKLAVPKRKRYRVKRKEPPFPVTIGSVTCVKPSNEQWCYYTGRLVDDHVEVSHSGDMDFLYNMVSNNLALFISCLSSCVSLISVCQSVRNIFLYFDMHAS